MAKGKLYEYAVLYHPKKTKEQRDSGEDAKSVVVQEPKLVLALSEQEVAILSARGLPDEYVSKLEDVEIIVRPF